MANELPLNSGMSRLYIIHQPAGNKYTRDGFNSRWRKAKEDISDLKENLYEKQAISGHKNVEQTARYDKKLRSFQWGEDNRIL